MAAEMVNSFRLDMYDMGTYFTAQIVRDTGPNRSIVLGSGDGDTMEMALHRACTGVTQKEPNLLQRDSGRLSRMPLVEPC